MNQLARLLSLLALASSLAYAQNPGTGLYAFGSFDSRGFDSVNIGNLNTHFEIPIVNKQGRGINFSYVMAYDGLIWTPSNAAGTGTWTPDPSWGFHGQFLGSGYNGYLTNSQLTLECTEAGLSRPVPGVFLTDFVYHDAFGKNHTFSYSLKTCPGSGEIVTGNGLATDGSGLSYGSDGHVHTRNGSIINAPVYLAGANSSTNGSITDSNGNVVSNNGNGTFTDTSGTTALTIAGSGTPSSPMTFSYPVTLQGGSNPTTAAVTVYYKAYTVQTNFGCANISEYGATSVNLVDHITLPDANSSTYTFTYESTPDVSGSVTGRLASITLPTGGVISYSYVDGGCASNTGINADGSVGSLVRTTSDGTRSYTRAATSIASNTTLQDEKGNQTLYQFTTYGGLFYETHHQTYQGSVGSTALVDVATCYNGATPSGTPPSCDGAALTAQITSTSTVTMYNGLSASTTANTYDLSGMLTRSTVSGGTASRITTNVYNAQELLTSTAVQDGANNTLSGTTYGYDETTPTATSGIPQHVAATGTGGNLTSIHINVPTATPQTIDTTIAYYDTGVPISVTTPNGTTSYGYDSTQTFAQSTTLPTPSSGVPLSTSASYDARSGAALSATGYNSGQTASIAQYDGLLRPITINLPIGQIIYDYSSTNQVGIANPIGNGQTADTQQLVDPYGRLSRTAVSNGQSSNPWYQTDSCYDVTGLLQFQSLRYAGQGWATPKECSGSGASYVYDALGRVTSSTNADGTTTYSYSGRAVKKTDVNNVQTITQYDALGRIAGICEISSNTSMPGSGSPVSCGMDIAGTGFVTSYAYSGRTTKITQGAQTTRSFQVDEAGRAETVVEPERGTTSYIYSYNSTGLQVVRARPRANQTNASILTHTTTQYDSLGRVVNISYDDGTMAKTYGYDATANWPKIQANLKGMLSAVSIGGPSQAYWAAGTFSYDLMGRTTQTEQCVPSGCGNSSLNRVSTYIYDNVGNMLSTSDPATGTINYSYSAASEVASITNASYSSSQDPPNIVSSVTNGPFGPTSYVLGNGIDVVQSYDPLGRMNGRWDCFNSISTYCNGGSQVYGWTDAYSANRITALDDTALDQHINLGYDEFNRLSSASMTPHPGGPTAGSFTYSYDRWGNRLNQQVTQGSGPAPSFSVNPLTNQFTQFTYDAAGNLLSDGIHSYTYDAEGNVTQVDNGSTATYEYDALNRRVRVQSTDVTAEYVFNLSGQPSSAWTPSTEAALEARTYWGAEQIAYRTAAYGTFFNHHDYVGTERVRTTPNGNVATTYSSLPWGDDYTPSTNESPWLNNFNMPHFSMLTHDEESNTDHAQFRQYSNTQGRWMSPDPYDGSYDITNPQSFNRYTYVLNNPLGLSDRMGLCGDEQDGEGAGDGGIGEAASYNFDGTGGGACGNGDPPPSCPAGQELNGGSCVPIPQTPSAGTVNVNDGGSDPVSVVAVSGSGSGGGGGGGGQASSKGPCTVAPAANRTVVSGNYTVPLTAVGAAIGGLVGGPAGAFAGGVIGSMFGAGISVSYVPSTQSLYVGPTATVGLGISGGGGVSASTVVVPAGQNPNSIANGTSYSLTYQPTPFTGSTVTKSPGSGPPVVGPSVGTRIPVAGSASHSFCIYHCGC